MSLSKSIAVYLMFFIGVAAGIKIPKVVTPDMLDSKGYYWINRPGKTETLDDLLYDQRRFWDDAEDDAEEEKPPLAGDAAPKSTDSCRVLKSGILECDGGTAVEASDAAKRHLAAKQDADTCPDEGDECPAAVALAAEPAAEPEAEPAAEPVELATAPAAAQAASPDCPPGWIRLEDTCYDAAYRMRAGQRTARRYCRAVGGDLLLPVSRREAVYFLTFFSDLWVGAEYSAPAGRWQWLDGAPLPANVTLLGGSRPEAALRCVRLHTGDVGSGAVSFVKTACGALHPFACRAPLATLLRWQTDAAEPAPAAGCPPRWTAVDGWCHLTPRLVGDWANGELWCNNHRGSKLVSLRSRRQELAVDALVGNASSYHIGMRYRRAPRNWGWMDGDKSAYRNWKHGKDPTWAGGDRDVSCAYRHVKKDYWAPTECSTEKLFVCAFKMPDAPKTEDAKAES